MANMAFLIKKGAGSAGRWICSRPLSGRAKIVYPPMAVDAFASSLQLFVYLMTVIAVVFSWLSVPR